MEKFAGCWLLLKPLGIGLSSCTEINTGTQFFDMPVWLTVLFACVLLTVAASVL